MLNMPAKKIYVLEFGDEMVAAYDTWDHAFVAAINYFCDWCIQNKLTTFAVIDLDTLRTRGEIPELMFIHSVDLYERIPEGE